MNSEETLPGSFAIPPSCVLFAEYVLCGLLLGTALPVVAGDRVAVEVTVGDALARPNRAVRVEARVIERGILRARGVGGERVGLWVEGTKVAASMTGGDGRAYFEFEPTRLGLFPTTVRVSESPRVNDAEGEGFLAVWEKRRPILLVEQAALTERTPPVAPGPLPGTPIELGHPAAEAAEELSRLAKFFYNVVYLQPIGSATATGSADFHSWLKTHHFPNGIVLSVPTSPADLETVLTQLKTEGWENLRAGVGRTSGFAQALVAQRITVAVIETETSDTLPRKVRRAKDWKAVRKHLQD